jgi:hypothetical protein
MATGNPLIDQGVLNRIRGQVTWTNFPGLNVTAPFLDKDGINLRLEGASSLQHGTMTGLVQSPEPYMPVSVVIALLKTQSLSNLYKLQMENNSVLGPGTVFPDVSTGVSQYSLQNMAIETVGELLFNGTTPIFAVTCRGYYVINNALFQ